MRVVWQALALKMRLFICPRCERLSPRGEMTHMDSMNAGQPQDNNGLPVTLAHMQGNYIQNASGQHLGIQCSQTGLEAAGQSFGFSTLVVIDAKTHEGTSRSGFARLMSASMKCRMRCHCKVA